MRHSGEPGDFGDLGRSSEPALFIMLSLADGPKHGYAMIEDILGIAGVQLGPGTLYGAIARLEAQGLIEALEPERRRNPYRLTETGERALRARIASLSAIVRVGEQRLS